jgi:acetyltransferase-like isoleucine patch superfamily enzyme
VTALLHTIKGRSDDSPAGEPYEVQAQTELRGVLEDRGRSAFAKYTQLAVGRPGVLALLKYELLTGLLGSVPGALGFFLRQKFYRLLLGSCGRGVAFGRNVTIRHPHRIHIGDRVVIDDNAVLDAKGDHPRAIQIGDDAIIGRGSILSCKSGTISLGARANISANCTLISESTLTIGDRVLIAGHCYIIAGGNHGLSRVDMAPIDQPRLERGGVRIADNCWLGASVTVLDGVTLGRDAVIAAGAVVKRSVPAFCIAAGVPAKVRYDRRERAGRQATEGGTEQPDVDQGTR